MKKLLLIAFLFIGIVAKADNLLVIEMKDASKVTFNLEEKPGIGLYENKLFVNTNNINTFYPIDNIQKIYFSDSNINTSVNGIEDCILEINFTYKNEILTIDGLSDVNNINIYDSTGKKYNTYIDYNGDNIHIPFIEMPKGIYIVSIDKKHSIKIIK